MTDAGRVVVIGSANVDLVVEVDRRPAPGETILGRGHRRFAGGKGANQAVAAARAGANAALIACVGDDISGDGLLADLMESGVDVARVRRVPGVPTGVAFITVTPDGENSIVVSPGANACLGAAMLDGAASLIGGAAVVCAQLEVPLSAVRRGLQLGRESAALTVLTPAPATVEAASLLALADVVVPNLGEARTLLGDPSATAEEAASRLRELGARSAVVTLGGAGAMVASPEGLTRLAPLPVDAVVDTTGAGDTLAGVLAAGLARGLPLVHAGRRAVRAAGISVTRPGAQSSMPTLAEIDAVDRGRDP